MPTIRGFRQKAFMCGLYEAQDVLCQIDDVDLIHLEARPSFTWMEKYLRRLLYHDVSRKLVFTNPGLKPVHLAQEYDLFIAFCQDVWDITHINAIQGWKDRCQTSVCWIDELWLSSLSEYRYFLHALRQFDLVYVNFQGSVDALSRAINHPCHWLPAGVDTLRFSPYPNPPARVVDVYSIGRRWDGVHGRLLDASRRGEIFYSYDTFAVTGNAVVSDHTQHRDHYANVAKRSRYFLVAPGKMNRSDETGGQSEIGYRFYEGAAAGAVMIGQSPSVASFKTLFPWTDAVVEINPDGSDVMNVISGLTSDAGRLAEIGQRNAVGALLHHDWVYKWKSILSAAGMNPSPEMQGREERLKDLSKRMSNS